MRKKTLAVMACALSASMATAVHAEESTYGALMGSIVKRDSDLQTKYGWGAVGLIGAPISSNLNWEASLAGSHSDVKNTTFSLPSFDLGADLRYNLGNGGFVPFVLGGAGLQMDDLSDVGGPKSRYAPFVDLGVGAVMRLNESLGLRAELKGYAQQWDTFPGPNTAFDWRFNIGLQFGGDKPRAQPVMMTPPPKPMAPPPPPPPPMVKPAPAAVLTAPPPPAPATPEKPIVERFALKGVNFEFASDKITKDSSPKLDAVVKTLKDHPEVKVNVNGYTDSVGGDATNLTLSQHRAEAVVKYFTDHGIAAGRLSAKGFGKADPISSNATSKGRAENRRVELIQQQDHR